MRNPRRHRLFWAATGAAVAVVVSRLAAAARVLVDPPKPQQAQDERPRFAVEEPPAETWEFAETLVPIHQIDHLLAAERSFVKNVRGRRVAWLRDSNIIESAIIRTDVLEMPRCLMTIKEIAIRNGLPEDPVAIAEHFAVHKAKMPVKQIAVWDDGHMGVVFYEEPVNEEKGRETQEEWDRAAVEAHDFLSQQDPETSDIVAVGRMPRLTPHGGYIEAETVS